MTSTVTGPGVSGSPTPPRFEAWRDAAPKVDIPLTLSLPKEVVEWVTWNYVGGHYPTLADFLTSLLSREYYDTIRPDETEEEGQELANEQARQRAAWGEIPF